MPLPKVLIVGTGSIGERHLRCFSATLRADVGFVELNATLRETIAQRYPDARAFVSMEDALAWRPKAAVVATPAPSHVAIAHQLASVGIHLLIEKPLSTSLDGVDALRDIVAAKGLVVGVAYVYRSHPQLAAMRAAIHSGRFGKPVELVAVSGQNFPTYRPAYRDIYYTRHATGGGAIQDALTHVFNAGEWLLGPIDRLVADAKHQVLEGVDVEDTVHVLARHGEALGSYSLNQHQAPNESTITVVCERGTTRFEMRNHRWRWMETPDTPWHDESIPPLERDSLFVRQATAFLDALEGGPLSCTLDEGVLTLQVNLATLSSVETGTWQTLRSDA